MSIPAVSCPKCGSNIGTILYMATLGNREAYCSNCGTKIATKCKKCENLLTVKEHYCDNCGTENPIFDKGT